MFFLQGLVKLFFLVELSVNGYGCMREFTVYITELYVKMQRVWFEALKLLDGVCVCMWDFRQREKCVCTGLFVKALLPWAYRLNMKGSLTWQASPQDTPLWTMPGQTWHRALGPEGNTF